MTFNHSKPSFIKSYDSASTYFAFGEFRNDLGLPIVSSKNKILEYNAAQSDLLNYIKDHTSLPLKENTKIISFIGRLEEEKGAFDLYHAFKNIIENNDSLMLVYAGPGSANSIISNMIKNDNLTEKVLTLGPISRKDVANLIARSYVVVTPTRLSFSEGRCMTAMESLAIGIPLIAPKFGPFEYLIKDHENGLFYTPDSPKSLQEKMQGFGF